MEITAEELRRQDTNLEILLGFFLEPADAGEEANVRYLEESTRLRSRLRLTAEEGAVLAQKEQGLSGEAIAARLGRSPEEIWAMEKKIAAQIHRKRARPHISSRNAISTFYIAEDLAAIYRECKQCAGPGKRPVISCEELRQAAQRRNLTGEWGFRELLRYLHGKGCVVYAPESDDLRLIPEEESVTREDRNGDQKLRPDVGKWDLRLDVLIKWNENESKNGYDARHQAAFRKYLQQDTFLETLYSLRKQGMDGAAMGQALGKEPEAVYSGEAQIWHLYKATFPTGEMQTGGKGI